MHCLKNEYMLQQGNVTSNKCCTNLGYCTALKSIISRANKNYSEVQTLNNKYLTFHQLEKKSSVCQIAKREEQLEVLNVTIRNSKLTGTLNMHQRSLVNISNNNIPRLRQLVNVALTHKRSIVHR